LSRISAATASVSLPLRSIGVETIEITTAIAAAAMTDALSQFQLQKRDRDLPSQVRDPLAHLVAARLFE
jgi:hypothetical protein